MIAEARNTNHAIEEKYQSSPECLKLESEAMKYFLGTGYPQNFSKASELFEVAAMKNCAIAQYQLGEIYYLGLGTLTSNTEAYVWFSLATALAYDGAMERRDEVSKKMSAVSIARSQKKAIKIYATITRSGAN
jgi:hypothetical protein